MIRGIAVVLVLVIVFAVAMAPATLIRQIVPDASAVTLLDVRGTLWRGSAELVANAQPAGALQWTFRPGDLLRLQAGYDVTLSGPDHALTGIVAAGVGSATAEVRGEAGAAYVNQWLAPYDIALTGELGFQDVTVRVPYDAAGVSGSAEGMLTWDGGPVRYRLSGQSYSGQLPPLEARLGPGLETRVYPRSGQTPLLELEVLANGFVRIGITQRLTELAGNPWPGSHQDHELVLEVEEQLF